MGDDPLFELAELLGIERQDSTVDQPPVLDPPSDLRITVGLIGDLPDHRRIGAPAIF